MSARVHSFDRPERFVVGTVGQPGERTFYLQARSGARLVSVVIEKEQAQVLAERMVELLDEVRGTLDPSVPREPPAGAADSGPLDVPIEAEFRVGTMSLAWDTSDGSVVVEARAMAPEESDDSDRPGSGSGSGGAARAEDEAEDEAEDDSEDDTDALVVRMAPDGALAFAARAQQVVAAGRRPCPLCGMPLSVRGHVCPRDNGYRRGSPP